MIEPAGRLLSLSQLMYGTLNCIWAGSTATCSGVSSLNGNSACWAPVWSCEKSGGDCRAAAALYSCLPSLASTAARCCAMLGGTASALLLGDAAALPEALGVGLAEWLAEALGFALGEALPDGLAEAEAEALAPVDGDALALELELLSGRSVVVLSTVRKRSCAGEPICLSRSSLLPARDTVMLLFPSVITSASETPRPLTRFSMICRACSRLFAGGGFPFSVLACIVTRVPPIRSRPSLGANLLCQLPDPPK